MVVASGQQGGARRRAQSRDVTPVVAQAPLRDARVVRGLDRAAEGARVPKTGVVDQDQQHIRRALWRRWMADEIPVRLRSLQRPVGYSREGRPPDREMTTIDVAHPRLPS